MKINKILSVFLFAALVLASCAKIYSSPDAEKRAASHKKIAIVPPKVAIAAQKKVSAEAIIEQQKTESANFQKEIYSWMLRRKSQGKISVSLLDVETTNVKLQRAGHSAETPMTSAEMCKALEVDAVLTSNFSLSKPMSEGAAIAVGVLFGVWGATNQATAALDIYDLKTENVIWNYQHRMSGTAFNSVSDMVNDLMRHASRKMPYVQR